MIKIKKINYYIMEILLFFALFDSARNYTLLPSSFGYIKDICIYALMILNIKELKFPKYLGKSFYVWMAMIVLFTPFGFLFSNNIYSKNILIYCFKFPEIFILFILFFNWKKIIREPFERFVYQYVYGSIILCFVNIFGYFVKNPIVNIYIGRFAERELYRGRITVGQPAVAIFPVILAFTFLLVFSKKTKDYFIILFYLFCIVIATSNTGILSVIVVVIISAVAYILSKRKKISVKKIFMAICTIVFIGGIFAFAYNYMESFSSIISLYREKIVSYFQTGNDVSMNLRKQNWNSAISSMSGIINLIFGRGALGYATTPESSTLIENTYIMTYVMYGLLGIASMLAFFIKHILYSAGGIMNGNKEKIFFFCLLVVYLMHFYTLDFYLLYMLYFPFAMFFNYIYYKDKKVR